MEKTESRQDAASLPKLLEQVQWEIDLPGFSYRTKQTYPHRKTRCAPNIPNASGTTGDVGKLDFTEP